MSPATSLSISGTFRDSHVDRTHRRGKYNSLSNVRPEDRQVARRLPHFLRFAFSAPSSGVKMLHRLGTVEGGLSRRRASELSQRLGTFPEQSIIVFFEYTALNDRYS